MDLLIGKRRSDECTLEWKQLFGEFLNDKSYGITFQYVAQHYIMRDSEDLVRSRILHGAERATPKALHLMCSYYHLDSNGIIFREILARYIKGKFPLLPERSGLIAHIRDDLPALLVVALETFFFRVVSMEWHPEDWFNAFLRYDHSTMGLMGAGRIASIRESIAKSYGERLEFRSIPCNQAEVVQYITSRFGNAVRDTPFVRYIMRKDCSKAFLEGVCHYCNTTAMDSTCRFEWWVEGLHHYTPSYEETGMCVI